jgi:hypothetical protein
MVQAAELVLDLGGLFGGHLKAQASDLPPKIAPL